VELFTPLHRGGSGSPLVCIHGVMDSWRTWELVLPALERRYDVLAPTLPGHAGGPPLTRPLDDTLMADAIEAAMDAAGFGRARLAGNSLGGFVALQLAERGRADAVIAFAPAGGWPVGDDAPQRLFAYQRELRAAVTAAVAFADVPEARLHQMLAVARCDAADELIDHAMSSSWELDAERIDCPVRVVWGTADELLPWPAAARRYREEWLPHADWIELDGTGHHPQLEVPLEAAELILGF